MLAGNLSYFVLEKFVYSDNCYKQSHDKGTLIGFKMCSFSGASANVGVVVVVVIIIVMIIIIMKKLSVFFFFLFSIFYSP